MFYVTHTHAHTRRTHMHYTFIIIRWVYTNNNMEDVTFTYLQNNLRYSPY